MADTSPYDTPHLADEMLEEFDDICRELDIPYCLIYGTCLGFYRDGGYIPFDNDIDVKVIYADHDSYPLQQALIAHGFTPCPAPHFDDKHYRKHNILLEVVELQRDGSDYIIKSYIPHTDGFRFTSFDTVTYGDRSYKVPHPVESYLAFQFGEGWETPMTREEWIKWITIERKKAA